MKEQKDIEGYLPPRGMNFLAASIYNTAASKGFHPVEPMFVAKGQDADHIMCKLMLVTTEVAEAAEAVRTADIDNFAEELADIIIRTLDLAKMFNIDIEAEVIAKMMANTSRPYQHGGKLV